MKQAKSKMRAIPIKMPEDLIDRGMRHRDETGCTFAEQTRRALREYLDRVESRRRRYRGRHAVCSSMD